MTARSETDVRGVFVTYLTVVVLGLTYLIAIGLLRR
jgi:hypothetical protein